MFTFSHLKKIAAKCGIELDSFNLTEEEKLSLRRKIAENGTLQFLGQELHDTLNRRHQIGGDTFAPVREWGNAQEQQVQHIVKNWLARYRPAA